MGGCTTRKIVGLGLFLWVNLSQCGLAASTGESGARIGVDATARW
jgi:hypothetical protein